MYNFVGKNSDKVKYFAVVMFFITFTLLLTIAYKNDEIASNKAKKFSMPNSNFEEVKEFIIAKIKSPFVNINYEVKSGDAHLSPRQEEEKKKRGNNFKEVRYSDDVDY